MIKGYITMFFGALTLGFLAYLKYLKSTNEEQKENIDRLKKEIEVRRLVAKDDKKRLIFETKQKERAKQLKDTEITLDEIENELKNENYNNYNNDFISIRL